MIPVAKLNLRHKRLQYKHDFMIQAPVIDIIICEVVKFNSFHTQIIFNSCINDLVGFFFILKRAMFSGLITNGVFLRIGNGQNV